MTQDDRCVQPAVVWRSGSAAAIALLGLLCWPAAGASQAPSEAAYDLLPKGGRILDPANGVDRVAGLAIRDGRIAAIQHTIAPEQAKQLVDVCELIVTPGLVDIHFHAYAGTRNGTTAGGIPQHLLRSVRAAIVHDNGGRSRDGQLA